MTIWNTLKFHQTHNMTCSNHPFFDSGWDKHFSSSVTIQCQKMGMLMICQQLFANVHMLLSLVIGQFMSSSWVSVHKAKLCKGPRSANNVWMLVFGYCSIISSKISSSTTESFPNLGLSLRLVSLSLKHFVPHVCWQFLGLSHH